MSHRSSASIRNFRCGGGAFVVALMLVSFLLNWAWEMIQMPAYVAMAKQPWPQTLGRCTAASAGDIVLTLLVYGIVALATGRLSWGRTPPWHSLVAASAIAALVAVTIELHALARGAWSYTAAMPLVPLIDIGLWPFAQLVLLVPLSISAAGRFTHRAQASA